MSSEFPYKLYTPKSFTSITLSIVSLSVLEPFLYAPSLIILHFGELICLEGNSSSSANRISKQLAKARNYIIYIYKHTFIYTLLNEHTDTRLAL